MKKLLTLILSAVLCIASVFGLAACSNKDSAQYNDTKTKSITVGITNAAPMNYQKDGKWVGFDTELTVTVFNALGYKVMFKEIAWGNKYIELESGTIDCIWNGFTANCTDKDTSGNEKQRAEIVNMSMNYMLNEQCVVKNKNVTYADESSFNGKTVAYEIGSSGDTGLGYLVDDFELNINKKGMTSQVNALMEVNSGTADFAVVDKSIAESLAATYTNTEIVTSLDYFELEYYAIGFKKTTDGAALRDKVNVLLQAFYDIGYLEELCTKYNIDFTNRVAPCFAIA